MLKTVARSDRVEFGDGLRAVAIMLVVASHLPVVIPHVEIHEWGGWAVNCFFVLTGFLLARPYLQAALDPERPFPSTGLFLTRRFLRIYPLFAVSIVASVALLPVAGEGLPTSFDVLSHLFMLHTLLPSTVVSLNNAPLWTMPVDAAFYLALPLAAYPVWAFVRRRPPNVRVRLIVWALIIFAAVGLIARILMCAFVPNVLSDVYWRLILLRNTLGLAPAFCIGIALALVSLRPPGAGPAQRMRVWLAAAASIAFAALLRHMSISAVAPDSVRVTLGIVFYDAVAAVSVGFFVYVLLRSPRLARALLGSPLAISLGALAYAVYLFHYPILFVMEHALNSSRGNFVAGVASLLGIGVTVVVAYFAHHFIEQPFLRLKDRKRPLLEVEPAPA
jgi:peptidoglycan/LPS O-acetylase OafA/YrhL